ncbi:hypothetical protein Btru_044972, partial [Bulinus truncatus]
FAGRSDICIMQPTSCSNEGKMFGGDEEQFIYDAFLSYAYQDEEFVLDQVLPELTKRDLKVLVHGRDFAVGEFIASNIVTAVKESRKTLVVVTSGPIEEYLV